MVLSGALPGAHAARLESRIAWGRAACYYDYVRRAERERRQRVPLWGDAAFAEGVDLDNVPAFVKAGSARGVIEGVRASSARA